MRKTKALKMNLDAIRRSAQAISNSEHVQDHVSCLISEAENIIYHVNRIEELLGGK